MAAFGICPHKFSDRTRTISVGSLPVCLLDRLMHSLTVRSNFFGHKPFFSAVRELSESFGGIRT
jgi:hypothetical protein